jgi:hypothetical protein
MRFAVVMALAAVLPLLAGCASHAKAPPGALVATPTTGVLRGVVVDEAIRPLAGAHILVPLAQGGDRNSTTAADGAFAFDGLGPGSYVVSVHKLGFLDLQTAANVTAGVDTPDAVRVQMRADVLNAPGIESFSFNGFLQCSVTAVVARVAACNPSDAMAPVCQAAGICGAGPGNLTDDRFMAVHSVSRQSIRFLQSELVWTPSSQAGASLRAIPGSRDPTNGKINDFQPFEGGSPLIMPMDGAIAQGLLIGNGKELVVRVFSGYQDGTNPPTCLPSPVGCPWGVGATVQQKFQLFSNVFYGFAPPEGWEFNRDGLPPIPS